MTHIKQFLSDNANETLFSFEILPPLKGESINLLFDHMNPLMEFNPKFINVTYHREEYIYKQREQGLIEKRVTRKRPGTVGICAAIMHKYHVETVPHIICGGFTREETENALIDLDYLGITNVVALRGDAIKSEKRFNPEPGGHEYAVDLLNQIKCMNKGHYLDEDLHQGTRTNFCVGVAGYPEKHFEAPNMQSDLKYLKQKVDAGADYIVTQMFFDNDKFFSFVEVCRSYGITVPIIPGLKPLTNRKQLKMIPSLFHVDIPSELSFAMEDCKNEQDVKRIGVEWCIEQSKQLKAAGVPCLHYYSMGKSDSIYEIAKNIF
jgi:methylenetetrahydrofolate reductase (NADPH)